MGLLFIGEASINSLLISIVGLVYELVAVAFELFIYLANVTSIDQGVYSNLVKNFYLLLGVLMLFIIAFSMLKAMVSPDDNKGTENTSKIITNFVTSVIIVILLPTIFNFAFSFQHAIINANTIGKIFGSNATYNDTDTMKSAGNNMANSVFTAFLTPSETFCKEKEASKSLKECQKLIISNDGNSKDKTFYDIIRMVNSSGEFNLYADFGEQVKDGELTFNFLVALAGGLFLLYVVFSFCFDLGVRLIKLLFYQIIAPIPVFLRVVPDSKLSTTFNDWVKLTLTCYLEVFIRLFTIYFGVFLISAFTMGDALGDFFDKATGIVGLIGKAILILSVITFIKQVPKLIGDMFGIDSANMSLGLKNKLSAGGLFAVGAVAGGAITSGARNAIQGFKNNSGFKGKARALGSTIAGAASGGFAGLKSGVGAKSFSDMKKAASEGAAHAGEKKQAREAYRSAHGDSITGVIKGKYGDTVANVKSWAGIDNLAGLKEKKAVYDQGMGFYKRLKSLAEGEAELQAYSGQYKALQEKIINRDDFFHTDATTGEKVFDEKGYVNALDAHRRQVEAAEKRLKVATLQTIVNNRGKGNYAAIMNEFTTFQAMHADDDAIKQMGLITPEELSKFNEIEYKGYRGQEILANLGDQEISEFWDDLKSGNIQVDGKTFSIASNDNKFKIMSGDVAVAIARQEAENQNK